MRISIEDIETGKCKVYDDINKIKNELDKSNCKTLLKIGEKVICVGKTVYRRV